MGQNVVKLSVAAVPAVSSAAVIASDLYYLIQEVSRIEVRLADLQSRVVGQVTPNTCSQGV